MYKWLITYINSKGSYKNNVGLIYYNKIITCDTEYPTEAKLEEEIFKWGYTITFMQKLSL